MNKFFFGSMLCSVSCFSQVNVLWESRYTNNAATTVEQVADFVVDASGNTYVCGTAQGSAGNFDYLLIKYDNLGKEAWKQYYNGSGSGLDQCYAMAIDNSGNIYLTGWSDRGSGNMDIVTVKFGSDGNKKWDTNYGYASSGSDIANDITVDGSGNIYVAGASDGMGSPVNADFVVIKYDASGSQLWANRVNPQSKDDRAEKICVDANGNVYATGRTQSTTYGYDIYTVKYNSSGTKLWDNTYDYGINKDDFPRDMMVNASGEVFIAGNSLISGTIDLDAILFKIPASGSGQSWAKKQGGSLGDVDRANSITSDASGNLYITGMLNNGSPSTQDLFLAKYNSAGTLQWKKEYNGAANNLDEGAGVKTDANGDVYVSGFSFVTGQNNNYLTQKYQGSDGKLLWSKDYNGTGNNTDKSVGIFVGTDLSVIVSGTSKGTGTNEDFATLKYCQFAASAGRDTFICPGKQVTLTATPAGASSYIWKDLSGNTIGNTSSINVSPASTTTYIVKADNATGCSDYDTVVVSVITIAAPVITANPPSASVCKGDTVTLSTNNTNSCSWSTGSTGKSIKVTTSGTYTLTVTDVNACKNQSSIAVTIYALPHINAGKDTGVCYSKSLQLCATGGVQYNWTDGPLNTIDDTTKTCINVAPVSGTVNYIVKGLDSHGCVNYDTVKVAVYSLPANPTIMNNNGTFTVTNGFPGATYQWSYFDAGTNTSTPIPGANQSQYIAGGNGTYIVTITNANGCSSSSAPLVFNNFSIQEKGQVIYFSAHPNPLTGDILYLDLFTKETYKLTVNVTDITGRLVMSERLPELQGQLNYPLKLQELKPGMYNLTLAGTNPANTINLKFVKTE